VGGWGVVVVAHPIEVVVAHPIEVQVYLGLATR
jgi:hypothetical protein